VILGYNATTDSSTWPTNRGSRYFHGQSTFLGGRWYRERGATRGGRDAAEWDENRHRSETLMPVADPLYGLPPLDALSYPPAMANVADLEMEERGGGISEDTSLASSPCSVSPRWSSRKRGRELINKKGEKRKEE